MFFILYEVLIIIFSLFAALGIACFVSTAAELLFPPPEAEIYLVVKGFEGQDTEQVLRYALSRMGRIGCLCRDGRIIVGDCADPDVLERYSRQYKNIAPEKSRRRYRISSSRKLFVSEK